MTDSDMPTFPPPNYGAPATSTCMSPEQEMQLNRRCLIYGDAMFESVRSGPTLGPAQTRLSAEDWAGLPGAAAVRLLAVALAAVDALSSTELVHRDVKPANMLVGTDAEHIYLSDFGLARSVDPFEENHEDQDDSLIPWPLAIPMPHTLAVVDQSGCALPVARTTIAILQQHDDHLNAPDPDNPWRKRRRPRSRGPSVC